MKHGDFSIGMKFVTDTGQWRCTDVAHREATAGFLSCYGISGESGLRGSRISDACYQASLIRLTRIANPKRLETKPKSPLALKDMAANYLLRIPRVAETLVLEVGSFSAEESATAIATYPLLRSHGRQQQRIIFIIISLRQAQPELSRLPRLSPLGRGHRRPRNE